MAVTDNHQAAAAKSVDTEADESQAFNVPIISEEAEEATAANGSTSNQLTYDLDDPLVLETAAAAIEIEESQGLSECDSEAASFTSTNAEIDLFDEQTSELVITGWFNDPHRAHKLRYYDGVQWTEHVTHFGPSPCSGCGK